MCCIGVKITEPKVSKLPVTMLDTSILAPLRVKMSASTLRSFHFSVISVTSERVMRLLVQALRKMWHQSKTSKSDESGEGSHFARSGDKEKDPVHKDGSTSANSITPLLTNSSANERGHVLTEENDRLMNEKIDRLVAVIQAGRQLHFSPDPQTGLIDVSIARDKPSSDEAQSDVKAHTIASPENFGNMIGTGGGRQRLLIPNSPLFDSTNASEVRSTSLSSAWENVLAALEDFYALEQRSEAQFSSPVRESNPREVRAAIRRDGQYIIYIDKDDVKVATVASIPLDFNKPLRTSTPSIHSSGSDPDCSSPLFEKSLEALIRDMTRDVAISEEATRGSSSSNIRDSVSNWLERLETPPDLEGPANATGKRQDLHVFRKGRKNQLAPRRARKPLTAGKALKDVSNLRRPGYLQHNSFAQTGQVNKSIADPTRRATSGPEIQPFGGAAGAESSRSFIEAKWAVLMSNHNSRKKKRSTRPRAKPTDTAHNTPHVRRRHRQCPSPQKSTLQDPNRTAHFDLALARLEGRGPPKPYSPIRRYADETGLYGPDVLVERRPLRQHHPVPMLLSPFGQSVAQRLEKSVAKGDNNDQGCKT